jgi:hypothetical protein
MRGRQARAGKDRIPQLFLATPDPQKGPTLTSGALKLAGKKGRSGAPPPHYGISLSRFSQRQEVELKFVSSHSEHVQTEVL